jgi:hypothetical protein
MEYEDSENGGVSAWIQLEKMLTTNSDINLDILISMIENIKTKDGKSVIEHSPDVGRMLDRMKEFCDECPICCNSTTDIKMMTCCSYCVCTTCHSSFQRCAFCRTDLSDMVGVARPPEEVQVFTPQQDLISTLFYNVDEKKLQMQNLVTTLESLKTHGHIRILLMMNIYNVAGERVSSFVQTINEILNIKIYNTEDSTHGKGTRFKVIKEEFDDTVAHPEPIVLLCNHSRHSGILFGVDFVHTDAVVVVGDVHEETGTQLMGRVFRPLLTRDNSKHIPFLKIYSA